MYPITEFAFIEGHSGASTPGQGPVHGPRDRFKVVKIETSAPQKRGRWTCIEYADKNTSTASAPSTTAVSTTATTTTSEAVTEAPSTLTSVEPIVPTSDHDSSQQQPQPQQQQPQPQQQQQQQQQQLLSPTVPAASKLPLSLVEEIESFEPVNLNFHHKLT
jgi:hypothetical protein